MKEIKCPYCKSVIDYEDLPPDFSCNNCGGKFSHELVDEILEERMNYINEMSENAKPDPISEVGSLLSGILLTTFGALMVFKAADNATRIIASPFLFLGLIFLMTAIFNIIKERASEDSDIRRKMIDASTLMSYLARIVAILFLIIMLIFVAIGVSKQ